MSTLLNRAASTCCFFFFNDTATTEIYTLSLHDALPISVPLRPDHQASLRGGPDVDSAGCAGCRPHPGGPGLAAALDRKSTRLNSSHLVISYAVFCLKKKRRRSVPLRSPATSGPILECDR